MVRYLTHSFSSNVEAHLDILVSTKTCILPMQPLDNCLLFIDSNNSGRHDGVNKQAEKDLEFAIQSYHSTLKQRDSLLEEVGQLRMENDVLTNQARIKTQELNELRQKHNSLSSKAFDLRGMVSPTTCHWIHVLELGVVGPSAKRSSCARVSDCCCAIS